MVVGPIADQLASDIRSELKATTPARGRAAMSAGTLLDALGGRANVREVKLAASRLCVTLEDAAAVRESAFEGLPIRGSARPTPQSVHIVIGPSAQALFDELNGLWIAGTRPASARS